MSSYILQQTVHKERLGPMEPEVQLQKFAGNTMRPYSCHTQSHIASLAPQNGIPKALKGISRRSESKLSRPVPSQESSCKASKENPSVAVNRGSASSDRGQTRGAHAYERKKKSNNIPPRFRAENHRRQSNKTNGETSAHTSQPKKKSAEMVKVMSPITSSGIDTTHSQLEKQSVEVDCTGASENGGQPQSLRLSEPRMTVDLTFSAQLSPPSTSRRSSLAASDTDEELFQDALSYLPVPVRSGMSSTTSSAFVTPASSRSQSPVHHVHVREGVDSLHDSLKKLEQEQELDSFNNVSPEDSPSCGSHVTLIDDHVIESDAPPNFPYTFIHNSQIHNEPKNQPMVKNYSNDTVFQMVVGDIEVEVNGQEYNKCTFECPFSPVELNDEEHDSGCGMSIGSPSKSIIKHKEKRPGLIYIPQELSHQIPRGRSSFEFSSLSTASPQSSICSTSPLSLSPSPTPPLSSTQQSTVEVFQQWPDLSTKAPPHPPPVDHLCPNSVTHRPTQEEKFRMEQWRSNLLAQLRQQQEKLDQKKMQKEQEMSLPPQFHHMFLTRNGIPPPPPHVSLPPLSAHAPQPPHRSLPPGFFPPFPPHSTPMFMPPPPPHMFERPPQPLNFTYPPADGGNLPTSWPSSETHKEDPQPIKPVPAKSTHSLCDTWVLWYDKIIGSHRNSFSDYKASLKQIYTITSVEEFWKLFNNIKPPSALENSTNYHFFKAGINPLWEDPANQPGGKWVLTIKESPHILDRTWLEVLLLLIGGNSVRRNLVNGVVMSRRKKGNRIAIWTNQKKKKSNLAICKELIEALILACGVQMDQLPTFVKQLAECKSGLGLVFMHHTDSLKSGSSYQNESHIKLKDHVQDLLRDLGCR